MNAQPLLHHALLLALCLLVLPLPVLHAQSAAAPDEAGAEAAQTAESANTVTLEPAREPPAPESEPEPAPAALDAIIVTATRTQDDLAQTPISVSVTTDAALRQTNVTDIETLSDRLPNAQLALTPTNSFLFVRGLGTGSVRSAEQSVGFFVDGVFLGRPQVALFDFLDIEQVELLRGPQGALLGKNTVAGAVNVQTAPVTAEPEGYFEMLGGSDGQRRGRGAYSSALTDTLSARIAYSETDEDGYLFNTTQQRTDLARPGRAGRLKLRWAPEGDVTYGFSVQAARIRQTGDTFELAQASEQTLALYRRYDPQTRADITDYTTHTDHRASGAVVEGEDLGFSADWAASFGDVRLIAARSRQDTRADFDLDVSPIPFLNFPSDESYRQHSLELRLDAPQSWGRYSVGLYHFRADLDLQVDINAFENGIEGFAAPLGDEALGVPLFSVLAQFLQQGQAAAGAGPTGFGQSRHVLIQQQQTSAVFGALRWDFSQRFGVQVEGRLTRETKAGDQSIAFSGTTGPLLGQVLGEEEYRLVAERGETDFSPRISLLATLTPRWSSYATLAQGFKSGGFNNLAAVPERAEFDEERSFTYEAGVRYENRAGLRGAATVFHTRFRNLQVAALDGTEFFVGNAARAHTQGLELSGRWLTPLGISLGADLGYLDAEYDRYPNAPAQAGSGEDSQDLSGRVLQRAPRYSGSVQVDGLLPLPVIGLPLLLGAVAEGASHQFLNIDLDPIDAQPGYVRYNAYAALADRSQRFSLRLIGRNLADRTVRREAADVAVVGAHSVGVFPPRSVAVEVGYRFQ